MAPDKIDACVTEIARTAREVGDIAVQAMRLAPRVLGEPADLETFIRIRLTYLLDQDRDSVSEIARTMGDMAIGFYVGNALAVERTERTAKAAISQRAERQGGFDRPSAFDQFDQGGE